MVDRSRFTVFKTRIMLSNSDLSSHQEWVPANDLLILDESSHSVDLQNILILLSNSVT